MQVDDGPKRSMSTDGGLVGAFKFFDAIACNRNASSRLGQTFKGSGEVLKYVPAQALKVRTSGGMAVAWMILMQFGARSGKFHSRLCASCVLRCRVYAELLETPN